MTVTSLHDRARCKASEADRRWFERHPDRIYRMRETAKWEVPYSPTDKPPPKGSSWRMIVAQVPLVGIRFKVQIGTTDNVPSEEMDDVILRQMFRNFAPPFLVEQHEAMLAGSDSGTIGPLYRHVRLEPRKEVMAVMPVVRRQEP